MDGDILHIRISQHLVEMLYLGKLKKLRNGALVEDPSLGQFVFLCVGTVWLDFGLGRGVTVLLYGEHVRHAYLLVVDYCG